VQAWFDQGHTLLHSFWFFEAERSFRWAVKLDPDAPMPYWGLARTASGDRARAFLRQASSRKHAAPARARLHRGLGGATETGERDARRISTAPERPSSATPDDVRPRRSTRMRHGREPRGTELLIRQVPAVDPNHRRAPLSHPQLGRPGRRAGARELRQ
jgi:hypothetical protein